MLPEVDCGIYLPGSAVAGGLRPTSDVDLLAVLDGGISGNQREALVRELMKISSPVGSGHSRPVELIVVDRAKLAQPLYPLRCEFIFGEWLRELYESGVAPKPVTDPELTLVLAQARTEAEALIGPAPAILLPDIPADHIRTAIRDLLPTLRTA